MSANFHPLVYIIDYVLGVIMWTLIGRAQNINWDDHHNDLPFNPSALSLYKWAPIAEDLKTLDRKIVLNSVILKWDVVKKEFNERIKF